MAGTGLFAPKNSTVEVALNDTSGNAVLVRSTVANIPSAVSGYAYGCILQATDTGGIYTNTGGATSATFSLLEDAGGNFTLPVTATGTNTTTDGMALTFTGLTTGTGELLAHTTSVIASGGSVLRISSTGVDTSTTTGTLLDLSSTVGVAATQVLHTYGTTTGIGESFVVNALTTGQVLKIASSAIAIATTGRLFLSTHTGVTGTSATLNEFISAANDETVILKVTASDVNALGTALQVSTATTTGNGLTVTANALTAGFGISVDSSATAMTSAGRLLSVVHSGNAGVSTIIAEVKSAAADETVVMQVLASAALAAGKVFNISAVAMTTGKGISMDNLDALTTGNAISVTSNSADATARSLVFIKNDNTSATGAFTLELVNDAPLAAIKSTVAATSTNYFKFATANGVTIWIGNGNTPNAALSGTAGDVLFGGDAGKIYFCTGTTNWTSTT